jgi:hypothetical protein
MSEKSIDEINSNNNTIRIHHSGVFDNELYGECDYEQPIEATIDGMLCNIKMEADVMPVIEQFSFYRSNPMESSLGKKTTSDKKGTANVKDLSFQKKD